MKLQPSSFLGVPRLSIHVRKSMNLQILFKFLFSTVYFLLIIMCTSLNCERNCWKKYIFFGRSWSKTVLFIIGFFFLISHFCGETDKHDVQICVNPWKGESRWNQSFLPGRHTTKLTTFLTVDIWRWWHQCY